MRRRRKPMKRILVVILFAAVSFAHQAPKKLPIKTDVSPSAPRYQLFVNPEIRRDTLLLDTVTGKIWRMTEMSGPLNQPTVWKYEDRIDNNEQEIAWWKSHAPDLDHRDQLQASPKPKID